MSVTEPQLLDEAFETVLGRRAPFTMVSDWVLLSGASPDALALYWALSAHINVTRNDTEVWPGLLTLARLLQLKKPEHVAKYMLELEVIRAVDVHRSTFGLVRRNRYVVHQTPPPGYAGPLSLGEWYGLNRGCVNETKEARQRREQEFDAWLGAVRRALKNCCDQTAEERKKARKEHRPEPPVTPFHPPVFRTPIGGGTASPVVTLTLPPYEKDVAGQRVPPLVGVRTPTKGRFVTPQRGVEEDQAEEDQPNETRAPSARSAADARRAPTGSKARAKSSIKTAQSQRTSPSRGTTTRMNSSQSKAVRAVEESFPMPLRAMLPQYRPPVLRDAILNALRWRSTDQLAQRIERRWFAWGFARKADRQTGGEGLSSPVGVAVKLVSDGDCRAARCEDGIDIDTGLACPRCEERRAAPPTHRIQATRKASAKLHDSQPESKFPCLKCRLTTTRTQGTLCLACSKERCADSPTHPAQTRVPEPCVGVEDATCNNAAVARNLCRHCLVVSVQEDKPILEVP